MVPDLVPWIEQPWFIVGIIWIRSAKSASTQTLPKSMKFGLLALQAHILHDSWY